MSTDYLSASQVSALEKVISNKLNRKFSTGILKKPKKVRKEYYEKCTFNKNEISLSNEDLTDLLNKNIIDIKSGRDKKYRLTLKGLLLINLGYYNPNDSLVEFFDEMNMTFYKDTIEGSVEPLDTIEKALIITILGLGAISKQYKLVVKESNKLEFKEAVDNAIGFIKKLGPTFNDGKVDNIWERNVRGEGPILGMLRRQNTIQLKTENVYVRKREKGGRHYLDLISDDGILYEKNVEYLYNKLFDKEPLSYNEKEKFIRTLDDIRVYDYKFFKHGPPYESHNIYYQIKEIIRDI